MSNNGTWIVRLGADPETIKLGKGDNAKEGRKLRVACDTSKKDETRWFNAIVVGYDMEKADRLGKGDTIALSGQLTKSSYKPKKPRYKGEVVYTDEMPFAKIMEVIKSKTFFGEQAPADDAADGVAATEAPALDVGPDYSTPQDDLPF